jgi:hypothetical protein
MAASCCSPRSIANWAKVVLQDSLKAYTSSPVSAPPQLVCPGFRMIEVDWGSCSSAGVGTVLVAVRVGSSSSHAAVTSTLNVEPGGYRIVPVPGSPAAFGVGEEGLPRVGGRLAVVGGQRVRVEAREDVEREDGAGGRVEGDDGAALARERVRGHLLELGVEVSSTDPRCGCRPVNRSWIRERRSESAVPPRTSLDQRSMPVDALNAGGEVAGDMGVARTRSRMRWKA